MKARHLAAAALALAGGYLAAPVGVRRWHQHWGATDEEIARSSPGDDLVPAPSWTPPRPCRLYAQFAVGSLPPRSLEEVRASDATASTLRSTIGEYVQANASTEQAAALRSWLQALRRRNPCLLDRGLAHPSTNVQPGRR